MITVPDAVSLDGTNAEATLSLWINWINSADGDWQVVMSSSNRYTVPNGGYEWASQGAGGHYFYPNGINGNNYNLGGNPFANNTWQHLAVTLKYNTKEVKIYLNGIPISFSIIGVPTYWTSLAILDNWLWGGNSTIPSRYFNGLMDEIRVQTVARKQGWLTTEFNNQNDPSGFLQSISAEATCSGFSFSNICSGSPITYSVPNTAGHTYSWSVEGGTPLPATGNSTMVTWNSSGPYSIQLIETSGSCSASSIKYTVSVNPSPTSPSVTNGSRCGTGTVTLEASGADVGEGYKWYDALTGGSSLQTNGGSYTTTSITVTTNYYVTKYNTTTNCESYPRSLVVATINAVPLGVSTPSTQTVCSDAAITTIVLSTSNSMTGTTYAWTRDNTVSVTGLAAAGSGDISGTPINVIGTDQTVTYTITPTSAAGCVGNPFTATVTVRSKPVGVSTPSTQTVCSDAAITTIVLSMSNSMTGTTYAWTRDNTVSVTGLAAAGSGDISGTPINVTGTDQTVTFTIIPTSGNGCAVDAITATVLVLSL